MAASLTSAQAPFDESSSLTLESVFTTPPQATQPQGPEVSEVSVSWPVLDPFGGIFEIPPQESFRARQPELTPTLAGQELALPKLPPRGHGEGAYVPSKARQPLFVERKLAPGKEEPAAEVAIVNGFTELCVKLTLTPETEDDERTPLTFSLAPETSESFRLPPGNWRATREVWAWTGHPEGRLVEDYESQELDPRNRYELELSPIEERVLVNNLSSD